MGESGGKIHGGGIYQIFRNSFLDSIIATSIGFYEVNLTKDLILGDFSINENGREVSVLKKFGFPVPCGFSEFMRKWYETMIPDSQKESASFFLNIRQLLLDYYDKGLYEVFYQYWTKALSSSEIYTTQRFIMTKDSDGDIIALSVCNDLTKNRLLHEKAECELIKKIRVRGQAHGRRQLQQIQGEHEECQIPGVHCRG